MSLFNIGPVCDWCGKTKANFYSTPDGLVLCTYCYRRWEESDRMHRHNRAKI